MVVDILGFGRWPDPDQLRARAALRNSTRTAFEEAGIRWSRLVVEDRGDGMIILVPASVPKFQLLDPMTPNLASRLAAHNEPAGETRRMRLRVSIHAGEIQRDSDGWVGTDLNRACRLVSAEPLYRQLRRSPQADLVLVISDLIHDSVVRHGYGRIDPATYTAVPIATKEFNARAWLHVA